MSRTIPTWAGNQPAISCPRTRHEMAERRRREQEKKEEKKKENKEET